MSKKKAKKNKATKKVVKAVKAAKKTEQKKVDHLQTQLNDAHHHLSGVLRVFGNKALLDYLVAFAKREVDDHSLEVQSNPEWCKMMGKNSPKIKSHINKVAQYFKDARDENKEMLSLLKKVVKQHDKIAKLHRP